MGRLHIHSKETIVIMWHNYFDKIYLINLAFRKDRLESSTKILNDLEIPFELVEAIHDKEFPCRGLVKTMQGIMFKALEKGYEKILIFEDDIEVLVSKDILNETMNNCVQQLPEWNLFYLGCNVAGGLTEFYSENLLPIRLAFATHATAYDKKAMQAICKQPIIEPVDNWLVREFQPHAKCFVSYPMLVTQKPCYSDIGKAFTDWSRFLSVRFDAEIERLKKEDKFYKF